jgi:hypothetical protein
MARNAADAARSARPQGEFQYRSVCFMDRCWVQGTGWKSRTREFNPPISLTKISILKNFREMFGQIAAGSNG